MTGSSGNITTNNTASAQSSWPLQSPKKKFTVWVFHEQFSKDTLFRVKDQFVQVKINWLNGRIRDLKPKTLSSDTRERRAAEREISQSSPTPSTTCRNLPSG